MSREVAVLFARKRSVYRLLDGCDVWDEARDARRWPGGTVVVAHPPCRSWGRLRRMAKPLPGESELALFAVDQVRRWCGVLEHPKASSLWRAARLPRPGECPDEFGGWTLEVNQVDWGHRALKPTWLYFVGVERRALPERPPPGVPCAFVENMCRAERERTPLSFARWLCEAARLAAPFS